MATLGLSLEAESHLDQASASLTVKKTHKNPSNLLMTNTVQYAIKLGYELKGNVINVIGISSAKKVYKYSEFLLFSHCSKSSWAGPQNSLVH